MVQLALLTVALLPGGPAPVVQAPDPEGAARSAAFRYESLLRRRAPVALGGGGGPCDEIIGRFCFRFTGESEDGSPAPGPEHPEVTEARLAAVRAFRRWVSVEPENSEAVGGLVRYLIESDRPGEAVPVARTHAWAARSPESRLLLGLALHQAGAFQAAEAMFDSARAMMPDAERRRIDAVGVLLEPRERAVYNDLDEAGRDVYSRRFWAMADPARSVPGNERRSAHYARHAWARILARAPRAEGMVVWADDSEEIVLRYGVPQSREKIWRHSWRPHTDLRLIESFDSRAVTWTPGALATEGVPYRPAGDGDDPALEPEHPRSLYAPVVHNRVRELHAQVTRLPDSTGWVLRVDASLPPDTATPAVPVRPRGSLVVLDTLGRVVARARTNTTVRPDSLTVVRGELALPAGAYVYQVEVIDDSTGLAGHARYRLDIPSSELALSDPLLAPPPEDVDGSLGRDGLVPFPGRAIEAGQTVQVFAQVRGLQRVGGTTRYAVEWWLEPREARPLLSRAVHWLGRTLGLADDATPVRVRWEAGADTADPIPLTFSLDLSGLDPGPYELVLRVVDRVSGREATSTRWVRLLVPVPAWVAASRR